MSPVQSATALLETTAPSEDLGSLDLPDFLLDQFAADGAALAIETQADTRPRFLKGAGQLVMPAAFADCMADGPAVAQLAGTVTLAGGWRCTFTAQGRRSTLSVPLGRDTIRAVLLHRHDSRPYPNRMSGWSEAQMPLLMETIRYWASAHQHAVQARCLTATLDEFDIGVFLFDAAANLTFTNSRAADLLAGGTVLRRSGATLVATSLADTVRLQSGLHLNLAAAEREDGTSAVFRLRSEVGRELVACIIRLDTRVQPEVGREPGLSAAMMLCLEPGAEVADSLEQVCRLYELTPTETRLAVRLVNGSSVAEASHGLHIKPDTARAYLKHIFAKTGARGQPDLIRILLRSLVGLRSGSRLTAI